MNIPDPAFVNWLNAEGYSACLNGNLLDTICAGNNTQYLKIISSTNIQDLTGIQFFKGLRTLAMEYNHVLSSLPALPPYLIYFETNWDTSLSVLPPWPDSLRNLSCQGCPIATLPTLPDSLLELFVSSTQLTALPQLPNVLRELTCIYNPITSLPPLSDSLRILDVWETSITGLPPLPSFLYRFNCQSNLIDTIDFLPNSLEHLTCHDNPLSTLPALPGSLKVLRCGNSATFIALPALPMGLELLYCGGGSISSLPPLPGSLLLLLCEFNQITSLPALPNSLIFLNCSSNPISSIAALPNKLTQLECNFTSITNLPELPDSMQILHLANSPQLSCLPELKTINTLLFTNSGITCLPNYGNVTSSNPPLSSLPLCDLFNSNGCSVYWNISGKAYADTNLNCQADLGETRLPNIKVSLDSGGVLIQQTMTGGEGYYSFDTDTGSYEVKVDTTALALSVQCPAIGYYTSTLTVLDSIDQAQDFGFQCKAGFDIGVKSVIATSGQLRPGNQAEICVQGGDMSRFYGFHCADGVSGSLKIIFSGPFSYLGPIPGSLVPASSGDTLVYAIPDFGAINFKTSFCFDVQVDTTAAIGSHVCFDMLVSPIAGDNDTINNIFHYCFTVVGSYDPNAKEASPAYQIDASKQWLTYTIHFQNTGTAPAQHIYILDTLDANLDEGSFELLSCSHQSLTQIIGDVVRFNFPNINLPDSASDEPGSHGYVQYRVKLKNGVMPGAVIQNTAHIVFDFNSPVATNTVSNTVITASGIEAALNEPTFQIYPNPLSGRILTVFHSLDKAAIIELLDQTGRSIWSENTASSGIPQSFLLPDLKGGVYVFVVHAPDFTISKKLVVVK